MVKTKTSRADSRGISMDDETYGRLREFASSNGLSFSALIRLFAKHCMNCKKFMTNIENI